MGSLISPTTALIYPYVTLQPSDVPSVVPEEDIFARAFEYATENRYGSKENDMASVVIEGPLEDSPDEIVLDEFLCREAFEWDGISPSSLDSSSVDYSSNPSAAVLSSATSLPSLHGIDNQGHYLRPGTCEELPKNPILGVLQFGILSRVEKSSFALDAAKTLYSPGGQTLASTTQQKLPQRRRRQRKIPTEDDEATKRKALLERNRMAAQKCRSRKRERTSTLEENVAEQEEENSRLKEEIGELTVELGSLRELYTQYEMECCHRVHEVHGERQ